MNNKLQNIDWDKLTFSITPARSMYIAHCELGGEWEEGKLVPYGDISLSPAAGVLNYGQGIFEGMKAYRSAKDRVVLFRPERNALRAATSAERVVIPKVPIDMFINACEQVVRDNIDYIPPRGKGSLYLRPVIWGTGPVLGVAPVLLISLAANRSGRGMVPLIPGHSRPHQMVLSSCPCGGRVGRVAVPACQWPLAPPMAPCL